MMRVHSVTLVVMILAAGPASAGSVGIGFDPLVGGTKAGTCHSTWFLGPANAVKGYQKRQKDRFEKVDPAVVEAKSKAVSVDVDVVTYKQPTCALNSGVPEKIILNEKGSEEPLLVIPLETEAVEMGNLAGAKSTAVNGHALVPLEDFQKLIGRELRFHLIYTDHAYEDKWKASYAAEVLKDK